MKNTKEKAMLIIEPGRTYRTRDGELVKVYAVYSNQAYCIHGAILRKGIWYAAVWTKGGKAFLKKEHDTDIVKEADDE